ncbi:MAG: sulfite exporter TauE/SafE family protein [Pseudomonadales bacterium]
MIAADLLAAFMLGLAGSTHCLTMCGGVHSVLALNKQTAPEQTLLASSLDVASHSESLNKVALFSLGRILSYGLAGLTLGSLSHALQLAAPAIVPWARLLSGLLLLALAFYTGRWWMGLARVEKLAAFFWKAIQPATAALFPPRSGFAALSLGALWGWIPCGMVYSALAWAVLAGPPIHAFTLMLFFGLGTLPAMLSAGAMSHSLANVLEKATLRNAGAMLLLCFAVWTIAESALAIKAITLKDAGSVQHQHHNH